MDYTVVRWKMNPVIRLIPIVLVLACNRSVEGWSSTNALAACQSDQARSPWHHDSIALRESFGEDPASALGIELWGVAANGPDVFLLDAQNTRILHLDEHLGAIGVFGRAGDGPGEFRFQRVGDRNWLTATNSLVQALTLNGVATFNLRGEHQRSISLASVSGEQLSPASIRRIVDADGSLLVVEDGINYQSATRSLNVWRRDGERFAQEAQFEMPELPRSRGRAAVGTLIRQADPLFAVHGSCYVVSDGSTEIFLRGALGIPERDTLRIPPIQTPALRAEDEERQRRASSLRTDLGVDNRVTPTAPIRWARLEIDPAGHVWLQPWRPVSYAAEPTLVVIVNLATGHTTIDTLPAFPSAFLPDGVILSVDRSGTDGITRVRTWTAVAERDGS
jgi:hypothetical protein